MDIKVSKLLTTNNYKTMKGQKLGYITYIMYMSPYKANSKGINICPFASRGCAASCLVGSGFGGMYTNVMQGRKNRTEYYLSDRQGFLSQLDNEIARAIKKHEGKAIVTIRLNGTSDLSFETFKVRDGKTLFELYPDTIFYDYTKNYLRFDRELPKNYHLTFSKSETNTDKTIELLGRGHNVAMVFDQLPETYLGYKVVNGDDTDLRFLDEKNVIVGLKYKKMTGRNADNSLAFKSGFAIKTKQDCVPVVKVRKDKLVA
jgi:hypothetical protein